MTAQGQILGRMPILLSLSAAGRSNPGNPGEILEHLRSVDTRMDSLWMTAWESFGITKEWIEQQMQEYVAHRQANDA